MGHQELQAFINERILNDIFKFKIFNKFNFINNFIYFQFAEQILFYL